MEEILREHNIKITPQRRELLKKLKELKKTHPSFNDVYQATRVVHPTISRSTIYENLKLLEKMNFIKSFHYNGEVRYEMNPEPHVNLVDKKGTIIDIEHGEIKKHLDEILKIMKEESGMDIKSMTVLLE